jgi:hypothetical protein
MDPVCIEGTPVILKNINLFEHQKKYAVLLQELLETKTLLIGNRREYTLKSNFFILNSKVGSGKTISTLLFLSLIGQQESKIDHLVTETVNFGNTQLFKNVHLTGTSDIIVVPHTVFLQWKAEICNFFPSLSSRLKLVQNVREARLLKTPEPHALYLIKDTMTCHINWSRNTCVRCLIVDEPHIVKFNNHTHLIYDLHLWLCATPNLLKRKRSSFIQSYFSQSVLQPILNLLAFPDSYVDACMKLNSYNSFDVSCKESDTLRDIHKYLPLDIVYSLFLNDHTKVHFDSEHTVVDFVLKKYVRRQHELSALVVYLEHNQNLSSTERNIEIGAHRIEMADLTNKCSSIKQIIVDMSKTDCAVCLEPILLSKCVLPCGHLFCTSCVLSLQSLSCPLCRAAYTINDVRHVQINEHLSLETNRVLIPKEKSHKLFELLRLCRQLKNRILIAVRCNKFAKKLIRFLNSQEFNTVQLHGQSSRIEKCKQDIIQNKKQIVILSDSKAYSGMNLQFINHIIIFSSMKKDKTKQVVGRAWRPGRKQQLNVYNLLYSYEKNVTENFL